MEEEPDADRIRERRALRRARRCGVEFERDGETVAVVKFTPRGGSIADLAAGPYRVTLARGVRREGVTISVAEDGRPYQFRLLSDGCRATSGRNGCARGERAESVFHALEPYRLTLWRYGREREFVRMLGWFDEHGPRAVMQITPDGDYTQTGVELEQAGYGSPHHTQLVTGPAVGASTTSRPKPSRARSSRSRGSWRRRRARSRAIADRGHHVDQHLERVQQLRRPQQLRELHPSAARADRQRAPGSEALQAPVRRRVGVARTRSTSRSRSSGRSRATWCRESAGPIRSPAASQSPRPGGMAAARLAGARRLRLRRLQRPAAGRRDARPRRVPRC